jgi:hypothetical protein
MPSQTRFEPLEARHRIVGLLQVGEQAPCVDQEVLAGGGQRNLAAVALKQGQADLRLELLDLH